MVGWTPNIQWVWSFAPVESIAAENASPKAGNNGKTEKRRPATGRDPFVGIRLPKLLLKQIQLWSAEHRAESRSKAIRNLVELGLKAKGKWTEELTCQPDRGKLMLADGIYSVHFETLAGEGHGVVVVTGDKIRGGDATFAYFGTLTPTDNGFTAQLETKRHAHGRASVFNMEPVHIHLTGKSEGPNAVCTGTAVEVPGLIFKAVLNFIHDWVRQTKRSAEQDRTGRFWPQTHKRVDNRDAEQRFQHQQKNDPAADSRVAGLAPVIGLSLLSTTNG
jgi:hypothetical protein